MIYTNIVSRLALSLPPTYDSYLYARKESSSAAAALVTSDTVSSFEQRIEAGHMLFEERHQELSPCHCVLGPANLWWRQAARDMHSHRVVC